MLLRNRSRAVTKPSFMADHSQPSPKPNQNYSTQKFRDHFTLKCLSGSESLISPTSILDTRALSPFGNPFSYETTIVSPRMHSPEKRSSWDKIVSKGIGLALAGELQDEPLDVNSANQTNGKVLFGTQLRVKIPPLPPSMFSPFESQTTCAADYGTKTKDSQNSGIIYTKDSPHAVVGSLSEMELSEEYTCVISHGPNPRTTHIFHNCILENYCSLPNKPHSSLVNFLSFCYTCKKHLDQTKDIFIYRDRAFCSQECRYQEMVLDEAENSEFDSNDHF